MKKIYLVLGLVFISSMAWGQVALPHLDPINYTVGQGLQTQTGWTTLNSGDNLLITSGNLSYSGLEASTGNKVTFDGGGIDAAKLFTQQTSGRVYFSFLLNITSLGTLGTTGGYFTGFTEGTTTTFGGTIWLRADGTGYDIGVNPRTAVANTVWSAGTTPLNTTLLVVVSYELVSGTTNDIVNMWINPTPGGTEPAATMTATNTGTDLVNLNRILIRQDNTTNTPFVEMDELRIGTTWADVTPSGVLPSLSVAPSSLSFGSQTVGSQSASQSFNLSGSNLTGAPGDITVTAPSTDFQVSNDNSTWGTSTTIAYASATLAATPVYVRFTPQTGGIKSGNVTLSGGGVTTPPTVALSGTGTATYYSKSSGNLTATATWGINTDGSGASPADFVSDGQVFIVTNRVSVTLDADMTVSGSGAKVVVGDGVVATELVIPATAALTATTDVQNLGTLTLQHATLPTFGTLATGSTVNYAQAGSFTIPQRAYYNLTATGGTKLLAGNTTTVAGNFVLDGATGFNGPTASPFATLALAGNFTMQNGAAFEPNGTGDLGRITLTMNGSGTQTISGGDVYLFRLQTPATPVTTVNINLGTATNLFLGNPSSGGLNLQQAAHTLSLNGNTLTIQQSGLFSTSNVGTITGSATSNVIVNKTSGTGNMGTVGFTAGSQVLNNFTYNSAGTGTNNLILATPLTVNGTLTLTNGTIQLGANNLTVAGTVSGGSATSYVRTNGAGSLIRNNVVGATTFPIGNALYNPLIIDNPDGYNWTTSVADGLTANPGFSTDKAVLLTWIITPSTDPTTSATSVTFQYDETLITGQVGANYINTEAVQAWHMPGSGWQMNGSPVLPGGVAGATTVTVPGLTFFSPFALANISGPLPVSFVNFSGYKAGTVNKLTWTTANEQNSRGFDVQRSTDGINYVTIGFVNTQAANGYSSDNLTYLFTDNNPAGAKQYYRLRQADVNGGSKYSTVIVIKGEKANTLVIDGLYPNPATSQLNVAVSSPVRTSVTLVVVDMAGQVVARKVATVAEGSNALPVDITSLAGGSYTLKVVGAGFEVVNAKFVKH